MSTAGLTFSDVEADTLNEMGGNEHSAEHLAVEALSHEIGRIVAERQELRSSGADAGILEANRRQLADAHAELSRLLIARYLPERDVA